MEEDVKISPVSWQAPEYTHKKKSVDFLWAIGLVAVVAAGVAVWFGNYVFAIFVLVSGGTLIMFTLREPEDMDFSIDNSGLKVGKDTYAWKSLKGFTMIDGAPYGKLLVETSRYFLPVYTIPVPSNIFEEVKESFKKLVPSAEIEESKSMAFMEKIGF